MPDANTQVSVHPVFTGWRSAFLIAFCALMAVASVMNTSDRARQFGLFGLDIGGDRGFSAKAVPGNTEWFLVSQVRPHGAAEAVGIQVGDRLRFDNLWNVFERVRAGQVQSLTVEHHGGLRRAKLVIGPAYPKQYDAGTYTAVCLDLGSALAALFLGGILLWRGWGRLTALSLALGQIGTSFSVSLAVPYWVGGSQGGAILFASLLAMGLMLRVNNILVSFVLYNEIGKRASLAWYRFYKFYCGIFIAVAVASGLATLDLIAFDTTPLLRGMATVGSLSAIYWAWRGLHDAGPERERFRALLLAFAILAFSYGVSTVLDFGFHRNLASLSDPLVLVTYLMPASFPFFVAWVILRHKAIDLGIAINRTLVFGMISAVLLSSFGLLEWAAHHLLPEEWAKGKSWIDGGIALGLFLVFHRLRDWVEHRVERWFFHDWQQNESKLRRFVASAGHFEGRDTLVAAFAAELARFCGVPAAVYLQERDVLVRATGGWSGLPDRFAADAPAFALMRAERQPLDLTDTPTDLPGVLALPMLDHGVLTGVALLPATAEGRLYRPDEVECLGWAALQVGLDLAALRARHLERDVGRLATQVETLKGLLRTRQIGRPSQLNKATEA